jgi:hypothetical protein
VGWKFVSDLLTESTSLSCSALLSFFCSHNKHKKVTFNYMSPNGGKETWFVSIAFSNTVPDKKFIYNLLSDIRMILHCKWRSILKEAVFAYFTGNTAFSTQFQLCRMD